MFKNLLVAVVGGGVLNYLSTIDVTEIDDIACSSAAEKASVLGSSCDDAVADLTARGFPFTFLEGEQSFSFGEYAFNLGPAALNYLFWAIVALVLYWVLSSALSFALKLGVVAAIIGGIGFYFGFDRLF